MLVVKNPPASAGDVRDEGSIPGSGKALEEGMAIHGSVLAVNWTEEPGGLWSIGLQSQTGLKRLSRQTRNLGKASGGWKS